MLWMLQSEGAVHHAMSLCLDDDNIMGMKCEKIGTNNDLVQHGKALVCADRQDQCRIRAAEQPFSS